jgi:hypothetical protein
MATIAQPLHAAHFPASLTSILVIASAAQDARATAATVIAMHARYGARIHLLAIQAPPSGYARNFLGSIDLRKIQHADGLEALAPLRARLDAAGVAYRFHVEIGAWFPSIARIAQDINCSRIVVGENPKSLLGNLALRHDRWRIASLLRKAGNGCPVVLRDGAAAAPHALGMPGAPQPK